MNHVNESERDTNKKEETPQYESRRQPPKAGFENATPKHKSAQTKQRKIRTWGHLSWKEKLRTANPSSRKRCRSTGVPA